MAKDTASFPDSAAPAVADRRPVRERLLASADELFYREGINKVGIDRVLEHAGVAKASLYATFGSKEELVRAYLQARGEARRARVEARMAQFAHPREQLLAVFDAMSDAFEQPGFRGCAFVMASAELPGGDKTKPVCDAYRAWISDLFVRLATESGATGVAALAQQLVLLYDGVLVGAQMDGVNRASAARATAATLLDAAVPAKKAARKAR
jgi:AcrR family transcriptional regulator